MNSSNGDGIAGDGFEGFFDTKTKANSRLIRLEEFKLNALKALVQVEYRRSAHNGQRPSPNARPKLTTQFSVLVPF